jgi:hypothetical protein
VVGHADDQRVGLPFLDARLDLREAGIAPSALMVACGVAVRSSRLPLATPVRLVPKSKARKVWK